MEDRGRARIPFRCVSLGAAGAPAAPDDAHCPLQASARGRAGKEGGQLDAPNSKGLLMRRVLFSLACATCLAVGPQAGALPSLPIPNDCPKQEICIWDSPGFKGEMTVVHAHQCRNQKVMSATNNARIGPPGRPSFGTRP